MSKAPSPFKKIIVAYDDSPEARDALGLGIELAKALDNSLHTITVIEPPPIYSGLVLAVAPDVALGLEADRRRNYEAIANMAVAVGDQHGVEVTPHLVEAEEVEGVISFLQANRADLLVIGLRQHASQVARLWSTVSSLEEKAPCSVLVVHPHAVEREMSGVRAVPGQA